MKKEQAPVKIDSKEEELIIFPIEPTFVERDNYQSHQIENEKSNKQFIKIPLTEEERAMSIVDLMKKYGYSYGGARLVKENGSRATNNPDFKSKNFINQETKNEIKKYLEETTQIPINSIETAMGNEKEKEVIEKIINIYNTVIKYTKYFGTEKINNKKFKLLNGEELLFGDFIILDKMIKFKIFRNKDGNLMMYDKKQNKFVKFYPTNFNISQNKGFVFRDFLNKTKGGPVSLEATAPSVFRAGIFKEEDFNIRRSGSVAYESVGPHERKLSVPTPYATFTNSNGQAKYYLGREKFVETDEKINHETVRVSMLDDNTGAVTDDVHGRKLILYTFPLLNKEQYEEKKRQVIERKPLGGEKINKKSIGDNITTKALLKKYSILDYISKYDKESDLDYSNRISKLSDTSYILGNFRLFMSETGLAANNYSWREQLILADALTSVHDKNKIVNLGKNFGKDGIRTFLSVEQGGKEMGDKIIELSNSKIIHENLIKNIFEGYSILLDEAEKLKEKMSEVKEVEGVNPELLNKMPFQIYNALLLRTKDILLGSYLLVKKDELNGLNILDVRNATDGVSLMLKILNDLKTEKDFSFKEINRTEQNFKYGITDKKTKYKYGLKIFLRPKAEKNAQARVNLELSFDTDNPNKELQKAFLSKIESHTQNKIMNGSVLRIGIDREERNGGQVSLDIGRSAHNDEELTRTGDVLGNLLAVASPDGHHTTEAFDPRFAEEENFSQIVKLFENYLVNQKI